MDYLTVRDAAKNWNVSERWVQQYCIEGRIEGVKKFGVSWAIPADAKKPADPRKNIRKIRGKDV
ncbi:MAG: helix-turn-helix domain-containing protein [Eubacteriales bacterium]|nr:helix-turn-helix domain-containing protein [Eubacteriales bacterium]